MAYTQEVLEEKQMELEDKLEKTIEVLKNNLNTVRAGRANPAILDRVSVDYYGSPTSLKSLANISVPEPRMLLITPFDPQSIGDIEKAIGAANIGLTPTNDGKNIRLSIPVLTEERRKELTKTTQKMGEEAKIAVRNIRRDANDCVKKAEKDAVISEDDEKVMLEDIQKTIDKTTAEIDKIIDGKNKEILEV